MKKYTVPIAIMLTLTLGGFFVVLSNSSIWRSSETSMNSLDIALREHERSLPRKPSTIQPYLDLSELYVQKIRESADASLYRRIEALMGLAEKVDPQNADIAAMRAGVALGRHDFKRAYELLLQAITRNPSKASYLGLLADSEIELGRYTSAAESIQRMINIRPDFSSWSRVAYIRQLHGDFKGAQDAFTQAITAGSAYKENIAWAHVERGRLFLTTDPAIARSQFDLALALDPAYSPALHALGTLAYAAGDTQTAEEYYHAAFEALPLAHYAITLADFYFSEGNSTRADQYYALAEAAFDMSAKSGVNVDFEVSRFLSNHNRNVPLALVLAQKAYETAPNSLAADNLAWALHMNGQTSEAVRYREKALEIGRNDASILFHQGMIAFANNERVLARQYLKRANALDPYFSLYSSKTLAKIFHEL